MGWTGWQRCADMLVWGKKLIFKMQLLNRHQHKIPFSTGPATLLTANKLAKLWWWRPETKHCVRANSEEDKGPADWGHSPATVNIMQTFSPPFWKKKRGQQCQTVSPRWLSSSVSQSFSWQQSFHIVPTQHKVHRLLWRSNWSMAIQSHLKQFLPASVCTDNIQVT